MTDNLSTTQVPGGDPGGAAITPAAPTTPAEPVAPATPSAPSPVNAESQKAAELERQLQKYENDIRNIKSSSDKRLNEAQKQWENQQRQLQKELQSLRMASMDDEERKLYEASLAQEQQQEIAQELEQTRRTAQEYQANLNAIQYFLHQGVPADKLVIDQGYDTLFNSGMEWMANELKRARTAAPTSTGSPAAQPLPTPPVVATSTGVPNTKPSWDDLHKKYGTDENIYQLVEAGLLPPDIIPG